MRTIISIFFAGFPLFHKVTRKIEARQCTCLAKSTGLKLETEPWKPKKSSKRRRKEQFRERSLLFDFNALYNRLECQTGGNECTYKASRLNSISRKISYFRNFILTKMRSSKHCDEKLSILPTLWVHSISSRKKNKIYSEITLHSGNFVLCVHFRRKKIICPLEKDFKSLFDKKSYPFS